MGSLLLCSRWIDALNLRVGKFTGWLILLTTAISAGNAIVRKMFDMSSNSLLEIQWYLFAGVFLPVTACCAIRMCGLISFPAD